ncbi:ABC transporter substrate-binding protein [Azospirillum isscasi]|uniref:ABC transporter substrate-binding protein n=1 Tax=Azospirillum isscasi TaxID=3053926 RepID=A0ABU0WQQ4_9PROT|nr:ABC transporter substrate-binding protein [Azospirillum isscasi]MDQ2106576.1 ABC transporter substrate-binding protein [Azospirillum isscasi]
MKTLFGATALSLALAAILQPAQAQEVVIGVPVASTGIFSFAAVPGRNGIETALEELNASGELGSVKLKLLIEDTASDKNQATTLVSRFAQYDKAAVILGPTSSVEAFAALPVAQEQGVPVVSTASADVSRVGSWIFKSNATPATIMQALGEQAAARLAPKNVAYVFNRDNDAYIAQKNGVKDLFEAKGIKTVAEETIVGGDTDFTALATKLAALDIDTLLISTTAETSANIIIQARQAGLSDKVRILGTPSMASQQFLKVGGAAVEGTIFVADYFLESASPLNRTFVETYQRKFKIAPDVFAAIGYNQLKVAAAAIKVAGPTYDRAAIRKALLTVKDLPTVLGGGKLTINENRTPSYGGFVLTVKGGAFTLL